MPPDKPNINQQYLESYRMTYIERVFPLDGEGHIPSSLPAHIEPFRQALLDFHGLVTDWSRMRIKSLMPPASAYLNDSDPTSVFSADSWQQMEHCMKIAKKARDLIAVEAPEHEWRHLLQEIFKGYGDVSPLAGEQQKLFDQFSLEKNILWDDTKIYAQNCPKPDFTYGYTINKDIPAALRSTELVTNFSLEVLGGLRSAGLISSPLGGLHRWSKDKAVDLSQDQLVCFPWAVVELHPREVSLKSEGQYSYSQAANGAIASLRLNEELSNRATGGYDSVPPVVAFTCVGAEIRVWLAYSEVKNHILGHKKMVCIWESSLCLGWGVIATCAIVKNMLLWASRVWKPKISGYISRIQQKNKLSFSLDSHVTKPTILASSAKSFFFSANNTQPTSPPRPGVTNIPVFGFGVQHPPGPKANDQGLASKTSIFEFGAQRPPAPKGNDEGPVSAQIPSPNVFVNKAEGFVKGERQKAYRVFRHAHKPRLPKANYDEVRESKQKQENNKPRLSHASHVADLKNKKEVQTTNKIGEKVYKLGCDTLAEYTEALEKLNKNINSLDLNEGTQATSSGIKLPPKETSYGAGDAMAEGTSRDSRDSPQGRPSQEINLENLLQKTLLIDSSDTAADSGGGLEGLSTGSDCQSKHDDGTIEKDFKPPGEGNEHDNSHPFNSEVENDNNFSFTGPSKLDAHEEQETHPEDFQNSPDEPDCMIGTCPHYGRMVAEALQLLWGDELLQLEAVSKIVLEIQGLELLDVTWSVLELWVAQHINVPSPCEALEKIIRELNGVLESPHALITPEKMWASETGTWKNIDKALQSILQSDEAKLKNILVWAVECMDLLESLELCEILKLGDLSCLELKRMDREIIDLMLRPGDSDPSTSPAGKTGADK
ncbi:hypothetical protein EMCG_04575 [[Emmonsia] crescens]|uniref:Uncharacterized protein n=1 Tax=[Emmonsia] crescens TaxID=73230 RepID=A0A0G2HSR4_9EURO|nr:hypothetical protein EMCG_04575 [Emmonsia crescens UAMH 3008]